MKLLVLSDLHNEFSTFEPFDLAVQEADVVVLAGDIGVGMQGLYWAQETFTNKTVIYTPGNHEFYFIEHAKLLNNMRAFSLEHGIHFLDNDEVIIEGVRFLGTTLWTDFCLFGEGKKDECMFVGSSRLNDFRRIRKGKNDFTPMDSAELHNESLVWLSERLKTPSNARKTVVVTHHLPSRLSVSKRFETDLLSACFASNLDYLFGKMDLWIHGHTHDNFDYIKNGTRVICNPRGYVTYNCSENTAFNPKLIVEV